MCRRNIGWRGRAGLLGVAVWIATAAGVASAQSPAIQYAYDELGRLVAVADHDGNTAVYEYDAVGNLLSIQRVDAAALPQRVAITTLVPDKGKPGTVVSVLGKGFGVEAGQNVVAFNGVVAPVTSAATNRIVTTVPAGATTGPLTVTAPLGSAASPRPFRIVGALTVAPAAVSVGPSAHQQFVATSDGVEASEVIWAVDGIVGGDPSVGAISAHGLYTAPTTILAARAATVTATSKDDVTSVGMATVSLRQPVPTFLAAAAVGVTVTTVELRDLVAAGVAVHRAPSAAGVMTLATPVAVDRLTPAAFAGAPFVSVGIAPLITSVSPATAARGAVGLTVTMTGSGLAGATTLELLLNQVVDSAITITNLVAAPDGTQATAQVSIPTTATPGSRVVRLRAAAGSTTAVGTGGNVLTVQ